ncbi:MAG: hypothetical protein ABMB14_10250 [Myxococcota bacterium]
MYTRRQALHLAILLGAFALVTARFWFVCDDAFITYRYAKNLALGNGLVFNPGEFPPVEGYSDFLWLLAAFVLEAVGLRPDRILPVVSAVCGAILVVRVHRAVRQLGVGSTAALWGTLSLAVAPAIGCWATSGLETMPQALLTFLLFERVTLRQPTGSTVIEAPGEPSIVGTVAIAVALSLIRTEGIAWVGVTCAVSVLARWIERVPLGPHLRWLAQVLVPVGIVFGVYTGWRFQYYGTLVPNTALVKVGFGFPLLVRGLEYVMLFFLTCLVPLVSLAPIGWVVRTERHGAWAAVSMLALVFPLYGFAVGGDFMPFGRLLVPGLPFGAMILAGGLQELIRRSRGSETRATRVGAALVFVALLPAFDLHLVPFALRKPLHFRLSDKDYLSELNRWANQKENTDGFTKRGLALAQVADEGDSVVAAAVGAVGYWSGITVFDQHGLVTKEIAYHELAPGPLTQSPGHDKHVDPEYFAKYAPRFLFARAVEGKLAAGRMKDTLDQWEVKEFVMDRYVPDYYEVTIPGSDLRTFLFVIRHRTSDEDPAKLWNAFPGRRRALNAELRAEYADEPDEEATGTSG